MGFKNLLAYKKAVELAMEIFHISKTFPKEETYALTDQIRRSSRSVSAQIAEGYRKRQYINHFKSKLSDADAENAETQVWLEYALRCDYITQDKHNFLFTSSIEVGRLIGYMMKYPTKFS